MGCLQSILDVIDVDALQELIEENYAGYSNVLNIAMKLTGDVAAIAAITKRRDLSNINHIQCVGDPFAIVAATACASIHDLNILNTRISAVMAANDNFIFPTLYNDVLYFPHIHKSNLSPDLIRKVSDLIIHQKAFNATLAFDTLAETQPILCIDYVIIQ